MAISAVSVDIPDAVAIAVTDDTLTAHLSDGRTISAPLAWYPRLAHATQEERDNWEIHAGGQHLHWPDLDEDLSVEMLLTGQRSGESGRSFKRWLKAKRAGLPVTIHEMRPATESRFREDSNMTLQQYSMEKYAKVLCDAVKAYDYPAVTYDFQNGKEVCHKNMRQVEEKIQAQLFSPNPEEVKDGLSNVLYWGYASQRREGNGPCDGYIPLTGRQKDRIPKFLEADDRGIDRFIQLVKDLRGLRLRDIRSIRLPEFSGVPFISKTMMFLCPSKYPVLDLNIAKFAWSEGFTPLQDLSFNRTNPSKATTIPLNLRRQYGQLTGELTDQGRRNEQCYENWAVWCRGIAYLVNDKSSTSLRAVDVERGLYQFIGSDKDRRTDTQRKNDRAVAQKLLGCPEGWTHDGVMALGRQTND